MHAQDVVNTIRKGKKTTLSQRSALEKCQKGNRSTIVRIRKGKHPERQGKKWPSGEECPKPKRYKAKELEEDERVEGSAP